MQKRFTTLIITLSLCVSAVWADDSGDGTDASQNKNYFMALQQFETIASQGNAYAQFTLGYMYANGQGVVQDNVEAVHWYKLAAVQGNLLAQFNLGAIFAHERGLAAKYAESVPWSVYVYGSNAVQTYAEAVRWYKLAEAQQNARSQRSLEQENQNGIGIAQNYTEAVRWYKMAAVQGFVIAQSVLGEKYSRGEGVALDYVRAYMWSNFAAEKGSKDAAKNRDAIARLMTPTQQSEAKIFGSECQARNFKNCD